MDEFCKKTSFSDKAQADEHIARIKKKSNREVVPVRSYLCSKCSAWHLTSRDSIMTPFMRQKEENERLKSENEILKVDLSNVSLKLSELRESIIVLKNESKKFTKKLEKRNERIAILSKKVTRKNGLIKESISLMEVLEKGLKKEDRITSELTSIGDKNRRNLC